MKKKLIAIYDLSNCHDDIDCECHYESFKEDLNYHFEKHKYKKVFVKGKNMTWRNLSGSLNFLLENSYDIFEKVRPQTSNLIFNIYQSGKQKYQAICSHHDSPMGEKYYYDIK